MAKQFSDELEKNLQEYKTMRAAQKKIDKKSKTKEKLSEESLIKKTKRRLRELYYGGKTYLPKKKKTKKTKQTKKIEKQAKENFGTDLQAELAKIRKKGGGK
jgi:hypothetical protein